MVAAVFYLNSWMGNEEHYFEGEDASDILNQFDRVQDLECLSRMGRMKGTKKDEKELKKLDDFLQKHYSGTLSMSDLASFKVKLSIGEMGVLRVANTEEEMESIRVKNT